MQVRGSSQYRAVLGREPSRERETTAATLPALRPPSRAAGSLAGRMSRPLRNATPRLPKLVKPPEAQGRSARYNDVPAQRLTCRAMPELEPLSGYLAKKHKTDNAIACSHALRFFWCVPPAARAPPPPPLSLTKTVQGGRRQRLLALLFVGEEKAELFRLPQQRRLHRAERKVGE